MGGVSYLRTIGFETIGFETIGFEIIGFEIIGFETIGFETIGFEIIGFGGSPRDRVPLPSAIRANETKTRKCSTFHDSPNTQKVGKRSRTEDRGPETEDDGDRFPRHRIPSRRSYHEPSSGPP